MDQTPPFQVGKGSLDMHEMEEYYDNLKTKIQQLSKAVHHDTLAQERKNGNGFKVSRTKKCLTFCKPLTQDKEKCVKRCTQYVTPVDMFDKTKYKLDISRMEKDPLLKHDFIQFQTMPETIRDDNPDKLERIKDIFAMPLAVDVMPPHAWGNMLVIMQKPGREKDFYDLLSKWDLRQDAYSQEDKDRLSRILAGNDPYDNLKKMIDRATQNQGS